MARIERHIGLACERRALQSRLAVDVRGHPRCPHERSLAPCCDGYPADTGAAADAPRVERSLGEGLVASDRRDCEQVDDRRGVREQDGHRVVVAGIAIKDDLLRHASCSFRGRAHRAER